MVGLGQGAVSEVKQPDFNLEIARSDIQPADIEMLTHELNLKETTPTTFEALWSAFGRDWFARFREMKSGAMIEDDNGKKFPAPDSVAFWANEAGLMSSAAEGLHSKLGRLFNKNTLLTGRL